MSSPPSPGSLEPQELLEHFANFMRRSRTAQPETLGLPIIRPPEGCENRKPRIFNYKTLPTPTSVRLLRLFPLDRVDSRLDMYKPIQCSIEVRDLNALSYTWGDPLTLYSSADDVSSPQAWAAPAFDIYCDGRPTSVGANLYTALLSLRWMATGENLYESVKLEIERNATYARQSCHIWIDALCIDQAAMDERSTQVLLMSRIYRQARSVKIWLGGEDQFARSAIRNMYNLVGISQKWEIWKSENICDESIYEKVGLPVISPQRWTELYAFVNRAWFKRAWIVQEVAVSESASFLCGLMQFPLSMPAVVLNCLCRSGWMAQICDLVEPHIEGNRSRWLRGKPSPDDIFVRGNLKLYQARPGNRFNPHLFVRILDARAGLGIQGNDIDSRDGASPLPLYVLCQDHRAAESTDARDKIYAFISVSSEFIERNINGLRLIPDYTKSTSEVYIEASKFMLASQGNLRVLSLKEAPSLTKLAELPSWVPDFSTESIPTLLVDRGPIPWMASDGLGSAYIQYNASNELEVRGIKAGEVTGVLAFSWENFAQFPEFLTAIPTMSKIPVPQTNGLNILQVNSDVRLQSRLEVLWRTLLTDRFNRIHPATAECGLAVHSCIEKLIESRQLVAIVAAAKGSLLWPEIRGGTVIKNTQALDKLAEDLPNWDTAKEQVGEDYTAWQILQESLNRECNNELVYPPEFLGFITRLEAARLQDSDTELEVILSHFRQSTQKTQKKRSDCQALSDFSSTESSLALDVHATIMNGSFSKTLFVTSSGHLGNGTESLEVGDEVWVLAGAPVPFLLRPVRHGGYRLVGEAYVHGIMHGEAAAALSSGANLENIYIV
jgi:hypothetical protein